MNRRIPWRQFFSELKRRNVYRVAATYAVVAFVGFQAAQMLIPSTRLPGWTDEFFLFLLIIGFPVALVVAWAFELTPEGIRAEGPGTNGESPSSAFSVIALVLILLVGGGSWYMLGPAGNAWGGDGRRVVPLAVLPTASISSDPRDEIFAEGFHEELRKRLGRISRFRVTSRTSVMSYQDRPIPAADIAEELGVEYLVEASVRREGDTLRISTGLVDAVADEPVWSATYDEEYTAQNVFDIQARIATSIANALQVTLGPDEASRIGAVATENTPAYEQYLIGRHLMWASFTDEGLSEALAHFRRALELDEAFALALVGMAEVHTLFGCCIHPEEKPPRAAFGRAREVLGRALTLDPTLGEAHDALAFLNFLSRYDFESAEEGFRRAIELNPSNALAHTRYGILLLAQGRVEESVERTRRAQRLDPRNPIVTQDMGWTLLYAGRHEEAIVQAERALKIEPGFPPARGLLAHGLMAQGMYDDALAILRSLAAEHPDQTQNLGRLGYAYAVVGDTAGTRGVLAEIEELAKSGYVSPLNSAMIYAGLGEDDAAVNRLEDAYEERALWAALARTPFVFDGLAGHSGYDRLMRRVGLHDTGTSDGR